jgi:hypothetical protein
MRSEDQRRADDEVEQRVARLIAERQFQEAYLLIVSGWGRACAAICTP